MDIDFFRAYGLSQLGLTRNEIEQILTQLSQQKATFNVLKAVIYSDREPSYIFNIAKSIGMYIPPSYRVGLKTYEFFIANIEYYETSMKYTNDEYPSDKEIFLSYDKVALIMKYSDYWLLGKGYTINIEYSDRKKMIEKYIIDNYDSIGYIKSDTNNKNVVDLNSYIFTYSTTLSKTAYTPLLLSSLVDVENKCVWLTPDKKNKFHPLTILYLKKMLEDKINKWENTGIYNNTYMKAFQYTLENINKLSIE